MPLAVLDGARKSPRSSGEEGSNCMHRQSGNTRKNAVPSSFYEKEDLKGHIPGRRQSRRTLALLCALGLGILMLIPSLNSLEAGASTGNNLVNFQEASPGTISTRPGPGGSSRHPSGNGRFLSAEKVAGELLSDGRPRCFEDNANELRCLPTVFFLGVSKCVTPHYSLVAEAPLRIDDFYGEGLLRTRGIRFIVLLREPVARTISSWEYKSDPNGDTMEAGANPETQEHAAVHSRRLSASKYAQSMVPSRNTSTLSKQEMQRLEGIERRTLKEVVSEGKERVERLAECIASATQRGLFGREPKVKYCRCNPRSYLESHMYNAHLGKSAYAMQLKRWFDVFGSENFKVVFTEDMADDPLGTLKEVLDFLSLDMLDPQGDKGLRSEGEWENIVGARYNTADWKKKAKLDPQVTPEIVRSMRDFFAPHNNALKNLLGVPLPSSWHAQAVVSPQRD